jgi:hypothetical protein
MIQYRQPHSSDLDDALRLMIKVIVWTYMIISTALALLFGMTVIGVMIAYYLLRIMIWIIAKLLHKQVSFSLLDAFYSLLQQTRQYAASQEV